MKQLLIWAATVVATGLLSFFLTNHLIDFMVVWVPLIGLAIMIDQARKAWAAKWK